MKLVGVISTAVLSLTLGVAAPAYAQQEQHDQQEDNKDKPAQEKEKKAQPEQSAKPGEKNARQEEKNAKPEEKNAQEEHAQAIQARTEGRTCCRRPHSRRPLTRPISDANTAFASAKAITAITASNTVAIGSDSSAVWPSNWLYTQDVYVVEINGVYYLCNASYPGVNLMLSVTL